MRARGLLLALCLVPAAMRAEEPDWFDAFRGKAYLQGDASFIAREKTAAPEAPPLFRARWVVLRYAGFAESERRFWPSRNVFLVAMPSGARYVLESSFGFVDESHLEEERPWQRIASNRIAFEVWMSGADPTSADMASGGPCDGMRERVRAPGGTLDFFVDDLGSRTVRASLAEIAAGTFDDDERRELGTLLRVSLDTDRTIGTEIPIYHLRDPLLAANVALRDQVPPPSQRDVVLASDPMPPGDIAPWRGLAHLPLDLPPFPPLPPEGGLK
jgi:hypothetical protein